MKFSDLILPKWKNSNPVIRLKAVKAIDDNNSELLNKIIASDPSPDVRITALEKISSKEIIENTLENDTDEAVRKAASSKLNLIFAETILYLNDNGERTELLQRIDDEEIIASLFPKIDSPDFRVSLVDRIETPELLCEIAESNCGVKAGTKIIDKIDKTGDITLLDRIAKTASNKKIRKRAADTIGDRHTAETKRSVPLKEPQVSHSETIELLKEAESALKQNDLNTINNFIAKVKKKQNQPIAENTSALSKRVDSTLVDLENHAKKLETDKAAVKTLETMCVNAKTLSELPEIGEDEKRQTDRLCSDWTTLANTLHDKASLKSLNIKFQSAITVINEAYERFRIQKETRKKTVEALDSICKTAESLLDSTTEIISEQEIASLTRQWELEYLESEEAIRLKEKFTESIKKCEEKIANDKEAKDQKQKERLNTLLDVVKQASEADDKKLYKYVTDVKNAAKEWNNEKSAHTDDSKQSEFHKVCDLFFDRLDTYNSTREWELWANLSLKKELCATVEEIASSAEKTENLSGYSKRIRDAQAKWKEIGPVAKNKSDEIWKRFQSAGDKVYSLCLEEKKRLLIEAEAAAELTNFNEASNKIVTIQQHWNKIGNLPLSLETELRASFSRVCDDFFEQKRTFIQQKDLERQKNLTLKLHLCEQAEKLTDSTDWNTTTGKYKHLQAEWKKTGPVPREKSDEIWERFSLACNTYFDNLEKTKPENMRIKTEFCDKADSALASINSGGDVWAACKEIISLQKQWNQTGPVPKEHSDPLWKRFRTACDTIFELREAANKKRSDEYEKNRKAKEALLHRARTIAETPDLKSAADDLKEIQETWKQTGTASRKDEQELWKEFREINDAFFNSRREQFQNREAHRTKNLAIKENLCLNLELLAKIVTDDPGMGYNDKVPLAEQLSIARDLRDSVEIPGDKKATRSNIMRKVKEIQKTWKETGAVPSDQESPLWKRYKKAGDLFYS